MSKKSIGSGITRLLFGLGKKEMKVIPYNEMTPEQFEQLDRFLGKVGVAVANDTVSLTKQQSEYILDQVRQLDLYRKNMMRDPDLVRVDKMTELKDPEFKGFTPKVIEGGKGKTKPGKINYDKMEKFLGVKLRGDETFDELLEIERKNKIKKFEQDNDRALEDLVDDAGGTKEGAEFDDEPFDAAGGGLVSLIEKLRRRFGKKAITTADKIDRPAKAKLKKEFEAFEERIGNRRLTEDELDELYEEFDEAVPYPMETVADRDKFLKEQKDYKDAMFRDYKAGKLDPQPGEVSRGRLKQLQDKLEEAEMSGDKRLITQDEMEELDFLEKKFRKEDLDVKAQVGRDMTQEEIEELKTLSDMDYAEGGIATMFRPKLKDGGPPNPGRRTFLKLMAGLASIPVVGKLFKPATKVAKIVPLKNTTTAMPDWFPSFVEKMTIRNAGNKIDADLTVFEDPKLPGVKVYKNDDGRIAVEGQNEYYANYEINYTPPGYELIDETTGKAVKTKGEFEAIDADPIADYDGSIADYEPRTLESVDGIMSSDARRMEGYAKDVDPNKLPMKSGEGQVIENEVRAEQAMDIARDEADEIDNFAKGGLATMFRKK